MWHLIALGLTNEEFSKFAQTQRGRKKHYSTSIVKSKVSTSTQWS